MVKIVRNKLSINLVANSCHHMIIFVIPYLVSGPGGGGSKVVATFNHVGGSFNLFMATTGDVWIIPSFSNLELCAARCMCHHELWPTSVSHPFSSLNSSLGFAGGKHYQKNTIPIFRLILQNFAFPGCFPYILFYCYLFSLLSSGLFFIVVCGSMSVQGTS